MSKDGGQASSKDGGQAIKNGGQVRIEAMRRNELTHPTSRGKQFDVKLFYFTYCINGFFWIC
mgnify:CR=1 FL=1|jgi:hypothetical protein